MQKNNLEVPQQSPKNNVEGFYTTTVFEVHEETLENYMEGTGSDIGLVNHEEFDAVSILESLYGDELNVNQRLKFVDFQQVSSNDRIFASPVEILSDRVTPLKLALEQIVFNIFESTSPKYFFDGEFYFLFLMKCCIYKN